MSVFYNDNDPDAVKALRAAVSVGDITPGVIDDRDIKEIEPRDVKGYTRAHFFAGYGGWDDALNFAGVPPDRFVWTGFPPCQSLSIAGSRLGFDDPRHLFPVWARLIDACKPDVIFAEQVASADAQIWLELVSSTLGRQGYAVWTAVLGAQSAGAPHIRERFYVAAIRLDDAGSLGGESRSRERCPAPGFSDTSIFNAWSDPAWIECVGVNGRRALRPHKPGVYPLADGIRTSPVSAVKLYGNAIVPQTATLFVKAVIDEFSMM